MRKTYLFIWNPKQWEWEDIDRDINKFQDYPSFYKDWSCGNNKSIEPGDSFYLCRVGVEPKGIIASGTVLSRWFGGTHWADKNKEAKYVLLDFHILMNPERPQPGVSDNARLLSLEVLRKNVSSDYNWTPRSSGILIKDDIARKLDKEWWKLIQAQNKGISGPTPNEKKVNKIKYYEGAARQVEITAYERDHKARKACLEHYGYSCCICGFNFEETYGKYGEGYMQVHHLKPISAAGKSRMVDPVKDLRPVCPNCHSMLHKEKKKTLSIEQLKRKIRRRMKY